MPLYEFRCRACGSRFDRLLGVSEPWPACASCGSADVTRLISVIAGLGGRQAEASTSSGVSCACGGACSCGR